MTTFTKKKAKKCEVDTNTRLNKADRGHLYTVCEHEFSFYDIVGIKNLNAYEIVEVKQRHSKYADEELFPTWYIEKKKIDKMMAKRGKGFKKGKSLSLRLCVVCDGKYALYDVLDIIKQPLDTIWMNKTTAEGFQDQGKKIPKEVYVFPKQLKHELI